MWNKIAAESERQKHDISGFQVKREHLIEVNLLGPMYFV